MSARRARPLQARGAPGGRGDRAATGASRAAIAAPSGGFLGRLGGGLGGRAMPLLAAAIAGALMAVQGTFNAVLAKSIGLLEASFLAQALGAVAAAALLWLGRLGQGSLGALGQAPRFTLLAGPIGLAIVYGVAYGIGRAGVAGATTAIIVGQVSTALLIDSLGLFGAQTVPFQWSKLLGVALLAAAGWIMLRG